VRNAVNVCGTDGASRQRSQDLSIGAQQLRVSFHLDAFDQPRSEFRAQQPKKVDARALREASRRPATMVRASDQAPL
jgi:hypothetical protein